jgi:beta-1,4-mannosyltransferase
MWFVARLRSAKFVVDWHNFGYAMLALRLGHHHPAVRLAYWYERTLGRRADAHFCVSRAMQAELQRRWGIPTAVVLYDRPAEVFAPTPFPQQEDLFRRLRDVLPSPLDGPNRPVLVVSPTSWTADEDFSILLDAVTQCDARIRAHEAQSSKRPFPQMHILITGKGPLREFYEARIAKLTLEKIHIHTLWLSAEDYPVLLGAVDLGLCLHRSSSGVDLPMKIMDMFGSGLPVCALDYGPCLAEQVRHGENGLLFSTSEQLAHQLYELFKDFPQQTPLLDHLRGNALKCGRVRWREGWQREVEGVFQTMRAD